MLIKDLKGLSKGVEAVLSALVGEPTKRKKRGYKRKASNARSIAIKKAWAKRKKAAKKEA